MKRVINLDLHVISINNMYYANKAHGYKPDVKDWLQQACHLLSQPSNKQALSDLRNHFDADKHCYVVYIDRTTPDFYNKKGLMSSRAIDISNTEKFLIDLLFTPAFYGTGNMLCENLNIDDKFITTLISRKKPGKAYNLKVTIKIRPLPTA